MRSCGTFHATRQFSATILLPRYAIDGHAVPENDRAMAQSKIQLNIRLDGKTNAAFDALAYKMGLDRPGLGHRMVDEMLAADAQGRELFDRSYDFDPRQAAEQVQKIAAVADETERRMRDIAKREAEVATLRRDDAERMSVARSELLGSLATRLSTAYEPFKLKIEDRSQKQLHITRHAILEQEPGRRPKLSLL